MSGIIFYLRHVLLLECAAIVLCGVTLSGYRNHRLETQKTFFTHIRMIGHYMTGLQMDILSETAGTCFVDTRKVMSVLHQLYLNVS